jgi:hypothetical protein
MTYHGIRICRDPLVTTRDEAALLADIGAGRVGSDWAAGRDPPSR